MERSGTCQHNHSIGLEGLRENVMHLTPVFLRNVLVNIKQADDVERRVAWNGRHVGHTEREICGVEEPLRNVDIPRADVDGHDLQVTVCSRERVRTETNAAADV